MLPSTELIHASLLENNIISESLLEDSFTSNPDETIPDDKSYCVFEVLKVNDYQESSQVLFETYYQVFEVADDGILMFLKTEGRYQAHFDRALIILPRDIIFSTSSNSILFSIKLIVYEYSSTVGYLQHMSYNKTSITNFRFEQATSLNTSYDNTNQLFHHYSTIDSSIRNLFWLMSIQKLFTDIKVYSSDDQEFHLYRVIIYASCEKFAELISLTKDSNTIVIDSINGTTLKHILKYIYIGNMEICIGEFSIDEIYDLLNVVDFFELFSLKNILTKKCLNHINKKNCLDLLRIADDKQMEIHKNRIIIFLCQQYPQIFNTDTWKQFIDIRPHLYKETFANLLRLNHLQKSIIENNSKKKTPY